MNFGGDFKNVVINISQNLQDGIISNKYNFLCDLETGELAQGQDFVLEKRNWRYGESFLIYKDFTGIDYQGNCWTVDSVEVYSYEW